jgi:hypothetical protein
MKDQYSSYTGITDTVLDKIIIQLLAKFKKYNANGNKLYCSYMTVGQQYENELLVIGRQPIYWREEFSTNELLKMGEEYIFRTKVRYPALYGVDDLCPLSHLSDTAIHDPFCACIREIVLKLGICRDEAKWSSSIALTYLYKIAYSSKKYIGEKPQQIQLDYCKEILDLELHILKPKRVLFLTGINHAANFLKLPENLNINEPVINLGQYNFASHKAKTVVSTNAQKYLQNNLVDLILEAFWEE